MATLTADRAASTFPVASASVPTGVLQVAWGVYSVAADPSPADIIQMCRVPAGATVIGGFVQAGDIDTDATETLDFDVGWEATADEVADPDGFGNFGVQTGDASVHLPVAGIYMPFANIIQSAGYKTFTKEAIISVTVVDDAATFTAGVIKVVVFFV